MRSRKTILIFTRGFVSRDDRFSSKLKRVHRSVSEEAAGSAIRYWVLFCCRILYFIFGKTVVARCFYYIRNTVRYFRRNDLITWYVFYWLVFFRLLIKRRFANGVKNKRSSLNGKC